MTKLLPSTTRKINKILKPYGLWIRGSHFGHYSKAGLTLYLVKRRITKELSCSIGVFKTDELGDLLSDTSMDRKDQHIGTGWHTKPASYYYDFNGSKPNIARPQVSTEHIREIKELLMINKLSI